jgi:hypothetical protein
MSSPLPTAREALAEAVNLARAGDAHLGRLWLDIATELRLGTLPVVMSGQGKGYEDEPIDGPLLDLGQRMEDEPLDIDQDKPSEQGVAPVTQRMNLQGHETTSLMPRLRMPNGEALPERQHPACIHCWTEVYWSPMSAAAPGAWRHLASDQAVCPPLDGPDQTSHTFAWPGTEIDSVVRRGRR